MGIASQTRHRTIDNPGHLPYAPFGNLTSPAPEIADGENILTSITGEIERAPGWATQIGSTLTGIIRRIFVWKRWNAGDQYNLMLSVEDGPDTKVYKRDSSVDTNFVLIHTATGSTIPFDFVTANDWCFFGNGTTQANMRKWRLGTTTYLWGIAAPTVAPSITVNSGSSGVVIPMAAAGSNWTDPTFALADDASYAIYNNTTQDYLRLTSLGLPIPSGSSGVGVVVTVKGNGTSATLAQRQIKVGLTKNGTTLVGTEKTITLNQTTDTTQSLGSATDLWATTLTEAELEANSFGVLIRDNDATGAALNINFVTVTVYYSQATTISAAFGYQHRYTYGNSATSHQSDASKLSGCTGTFSAASVNVSVTASADPQVDRIHVYRTTDSGSTEPDQMREIIGSPLTNATQTVLDVTPDSQLSITVAPAALRNGQPTPSRGFVYSQGRIWGFVDDRTYYSGDEEIAAATGVPQEAWPGGLDGNFYRWARQVKGHGEATNGVTIFQAGRIDKVEGYTLDTFWRYKLLARRGTTNHATVSTLGGSTMWLDTASQVWLDGDEIGLPIRPDIENIVHAQAATTIHISKRFHHGYLMDGANGTVYAYDFDQRKWMPPWKLGGTLTALASEETLDGVVDCFVARNGKVLKQTPSDYQVDGVTYSAFLSTNLYNIHPDADLDWRGVVQHIETKTGATVPTVSLLLDDDPEQGTYTALASRDPEDRPQGTYLLAKRFQDDGVASHAAQQCSVKLAWPKANANFKLHVLDVAYRQVGR